MKQLLLIGILAIFGTLKAAVVGSVPGAPCSLAIGFLSEPEIAVQVGMAAMNRGLMASMYMSTDVCHRPIPIPPFIIEHPCIRMYHNVPMVFLEGSDKAGHLGLHTIAGELHMTGILNILMSPGEKTLGQKVGDMVSASVTTHGRALNMLAVVRGAYIVAVVASVGQMCFPTFIVTAPPAGYAFASEGDHINLTPFGNWRGPISIYWFIPWLTPFTAISRAMETAGLLPVDYFRFFAHGGQGTAYPATGTNPNDSRGLGLLDAAYDALVPITGPFMQEGPLHLRLGGAMVYWAHNPRALTLGLTCMFSHFGVGGYIQALYPLRVPSPADIGNPAEQLRPDVQLHASAGPARLIQDTKTVTVPDTDRVVSAALWPRFTCCNLCIGSLEDPIRFFTVGGGFRTQLVVEP